MRTDRQTAMAKLIVAFRSFAKAPKNNNFGSFTRDSNLLADSPSKLIRWKKTLPSVTECA